MTAALPGAEVVGARALTAGGDGRFDSAVATLADGRELVIRVAEDEDAAREIATEALALRALTSGARALLPFRAPEYIGETSLGQHRALVTDLLPGFQVEAANLPAGRGAATAIGAALAALHALPSSVVRSAGLVGLSSAEAREDVRRLIDRAAATGRVPARLTVRWREAVDDDALWQFETCVTLGGVQATSFVFEDDAVRGPEVVGVLGWHGLSIGDPAIDLAWLSTAPDAEDDVQRAYTAASDRAPDSALAPRARLLAELEFARWLVHGDDVRRPDIVDDAAALLESLAQNMHDDLSADRATGVDSAIDALDRVPATAGTGVDTSMQTDAYNPEDLWFVSAEGAGTASVGDPDATADLSDVTGAIDPGDGRGSDASRGSDGDAARSSDSADRSSDSAAQGEGASGRSDEESAEEAQRAARAALQRWTNSSSE